jgi:acyl-coenzyme A synthetase/AMP-(fatty) acid ligase
MTGTIPASFTEASRIGELASTAHYVAWHARHTPNAAAIVEDGVTLSYRHVASDLVGCARALGALGVRPGALVGIDTSLRYQQLLLLLACEATGTTATSLTADQNDTMRGHCDIVFSDDATQGAVAIPARWTSMTAIETGLAVLERPIAPDLIARIVRTSGSTGRPKAMPMTHATQQLRIVRTMERVAVDILPRPRFLCLYSLSVGAICVRVLGVLRHGGTVLFATGDQADQLLAAGVANYAVFATGDMERLAEHSIHAPYRTAPRIEVFGAAVSPNARRRLRDRLNARVSNKYSSNETNPIAIMDDDNVGTLCSGVEARIVDGDGREVAQGETGVIRVKSETMVHGYFDDPELTAACFFDGWFQTGDLGVMLSPGRLLVMGRADGVLNIGGVKVAPAPIEAEIKRIEGIRDAVIMSIAGLHEAGVLLAALEFDIMPPPLSAMQSAGEILARHVAGFTMMPARSLPRTQSGKIQRQEIEAMFRRAPPGELIVVA